MKYPELELRNRFENAASEQNLLFSPQNSFSTFLARALNNVQKKQFFFVSLFDYYSHVDLNINTKDVLIVERTAPKYYQFEYLVDAGY